MKQVIYQVQLKIFPNSHISIQRGQISVTSTQCTVWRRGFNGEIEVVGKGKSHCSPSDTFDINTGRKLALKRAISDFSKSLRTKIWKGMQKGTFEVVG